MALSRIAKTYLYSNGHRETSWYLRKTDYNGKVQSAACHPRAMASEKSLQSSVEEIEARATRRARAAIRHYVMAANLDHLLTLTFRVNLTDYDEALVARQKFFRKVQAHISGWQAVSVPERQSRGAWHFHVAVRGYQSVELLRKLWRESTPDGEGNIHVRGPVGRRTAWARGNLISYLCKYISKSLRDRDEEMRGRHRYATTQGIEWEETEREYFIQAGVEAIIKDFIQAAGTADIRIWQEPSKGVGWLATW